MKELIIIVYKIFVGNCSRQEVEQIMLDAVEKLTMKKDSDLTDNYIIKEIWLPILEGNSDVKVIYPIPASTKTIELDELIQEITLSINNNPDGVLVKNWERLLRELKVKKLNNIDE